MPFFGICLGMQMAVVEFARNVRGLKGANSTEFDPSDAAPGDRPDARAARRAPTRAATMRLGAYPCVLDARHRAAATAYGATEISERHRHRYEVNNDYRERARAARAWCSPGTSPDRAWSR